MGGWSSGRVGVCGGGRGQGRVKGGYEGDRERVPTFAFLNF